MSRKRQKPIEAGTTIPFYIPQDVSKELLAHLNSENCMPLNTYLLKLVERDMQKNSPEDEVQSIVENIVNEKIQTMMDAQGSAVEVKDIVEDLVNQKMQSFMDEIIKVISSQGASKLLESVSAFEKKRDKLSKLGDL